ncbi:hypothetical protein ABW16_03895 [Mycolicibacter heraklionensis]|uniref:Uncharacterized protein n=1 Tax=Mycolicibacter heraklionensis TaxID=512402 RepID=A0ABR5FIZ9_9MYCO|nr:DUF6498-containing protein [Mycolicibacter heraklionensis]KLO30864.1 hypothetical protein ABW16_03895 [Mycolicibacter heraklionensis]
MTSPNSQRGAALSRLHLFNVLGVIAIPALGWFAQHWSGATTLVVYWFENVAMCLFVIARIALHRRWAPKYGHFRYRAPQSAGPTGNQSFLSGFALIGLAFCAAHGVFLGAILGLLAHNRAPELALLDLHWRSVGWGCLSVLLFLTMDFLLDLIDLRRWSFRDVEQMANIGLGRIMVVHLTLVLGFAGIAATDAPSTLFGVFVVLKSLAALSSVVPQWEPKRPPRWLSKLMDGMPNVHPGERFEDFWVKDQANERDRQRRNEQPWKTPRT